MPVFNKTKNKKIADEAVLCKDAFSKARGLMFSCKTEKALIFVFRREQRISLHMLFVFFPIDVLFIDDKKRVVDLKKNFMPFTFYTSRKKAKYVIELPNDTIRKTKTEITDKITF